MTFRQLNEIFLITILLRWTGRERMTYIFVHVNMTLITLNQNIYMYILYIYINIVYFNILGVHVLTCTIYSVHYK